MTLLDSVVLFLLVFVVVWPGDFEDSSFTCVLADGSQNSALRALLGDGPDLPDAAVDLNSSNFDSVLKASNARFAVVEFFAHWCPACRNYKPHYEKVAKLFNGADAVHPGIIMMTRVDCAYQTNTNLCDRFSVSHYPVLLWGPPAKFVSVSQEPKKVQSEIKSIEDGRTADRLLNWINKELQSSFSLEDEKYESILPYNVSDTVQIAQAVHDVEKTSTIAFDIILEHKMIKSESQAPLIKFLQLLVAHHPSRRCRKGSAELLMNFDELWQTNILSLSSSSSVISHEKDAFQICGKEAPRGEWIFCQGSRKDTRGFSCGLWLLLHSLSVRVADGESHLAFTTICDFIHNFFICDECRQNFYAMCSTVSVPLNTTRDLSLWFWSTHNKVNERLKKEEKALGTGDPKFPKMLWPPKQLCPQCYLSLSRKQNGIVQVDWNMDEVFNFLVNYYGKMLTSSNKNTGFSVSRMSESVFNEITTSTNAVAVPVGAALAIALASCAFGALACYWRMQQKNRKLRKRAGAESCP